MQALLLFLAATISFFYIVSWGVRRAISWLFYTKYHISLKIGRIGIPYLRLCDIEINKNGFSVHIDEISVRSSLISSDVTKLLTLIIRDVRINKDVGGHSPDLLVVASQNGDPPLDFRDKKIPHFINTFAQFMAVQVYNISVNLLRSETPGCLTHATASELRFDASILKNAKFLLVTLNLAEACTKVLRHAEEQQKESCLAEFKFGVSTEIILVAKGPLSVEKLDVRMSQTEAIVNDSFYEMAQSRATQSGAGDSKGQEELYVRFFPLIPKNCTLHIEDTLLKGVKETGQIEYNSSLKKLQLNYKTVSTVEEKSPLPPASSPHMLLNFSLSDLQLQNTREKLIALKTLTVDAKLKNYTVDIYFQLNALMVTYNHDVIHRWVYGNFLKNRHCQHRHHGHHQRQARPLKLAKTTVSSSDKSDFAVDLMKKLVVNACAEFSKVSVNVKLSGHDSSVGFNHVKLMLEQSREYRGISYPVYLLELLLHQRHWQMEFLVESFWWSFKEWNQDSNVSTKTVHIWGTPVYFVKVLVKLWTCDNDEIKVLSILDTVQLEWSLELVDYVLLAIKCLKQYGGTSVGQEGVTKKKVIEQQRASPQFTFNTGIKHLNCFFQSQNTEYFVGQLKAIEALKTSTSSDLQFKEFKIFTINNTGAYYSCIRSDDIANYKVLVRQAHWETVDDGAVKKKSLNLLDGAKMFWSPNLHLKALILFKDMAEFVMEIKEELGLNFGGDDVVDVGRARNEVKRSFSCRVASTIVFHMEMSEEHSAKVSVDALNFCKRGEDDVRVQNSRTVVAIDGADIFTVKGVELRTVEDHQLIREERLDNDNFVLEWNRTWWLSLDLFKAVFPYEHRYADAVQDELISIFKWLKVVHNVKRTPYTKHSPLPSDLLINVKEFLFEMSDDPFEVRLRDNFELLEDEYNESLKRQKMLKERIGQLLKTHLHLPAGKVEELYSNLKRKNADIYVMRSKQMLKAAPPRTTLFAWNMTSVELMILCDPSIHGTDNVAEIMKEIDGDSPWPEEGIEFSTLWCRVVSLRCKEWKFQLRDFPQPLLDIRQCYICGQLVGAEQLAPRRAIRDAVINLGEPFEPFTVERGMLPLKFYHDLNCEVESFSYAFGPCWEPVIAQCNLSFEKIAPPSRDPSPPLSFWDKMRLLWHGRLTMLVQQLTVLLHASLDPYNTTEEMELTWSQVVMDWTNAKFVFKGDLNIFVRTASKYDDCQLLHLPNVKLILGIGWVCLGDPNDHHGVIQCAPDKVPEYSSHQVHDSFRAFRSQNVNLSIVMETKAPNNQSPLSSARLGNTASAPADGNNTSGNSSGGGGAPLLDCPMLVLYGSTLRWIENLKLILSGVTRPTRRGRIFGNVRPKKTQLSRHYRKVHLLMGLHKFHVCYWMSFAMQRGCELIGGRLSSSSEHTLSLVAVDDGLKHRPKAEWSIVYMNSELNDSEIWLKSSLDSGGDSCSETEVPFAMMSLRGQPVEKCYCLSVAKVSYGREALLNLANHVVAAGAGAAAAACDRNKDTTPTHRLVVYDLRGAWTKSNRNVAVALFDTFMKNKQMKKNLSTEALKGFRKDSNTTPLKRRSVDASTPPNSSIQASVLQGAAAAPNTTSATAAAAASSASAAAQDQVSSPISKLQSGHAVNMLQQLIAEADNKSVVYSDDLSSVTTRQQHLQGLQACQEDDVQHKNWQITLVNAQVLLKGCETKGYVILSAAKAEILQRIHRPVWKERTLVSKTTWVGTLECMQYYATVNAGENDSNVNENIMWLTVDNIQEKESTEISEEPSEVPNMVGSGVSVGAVVSDTVGPSDSSQLQRIVSRCKCEFFYAGYGDISVDPEAVGGVMGELPPPPQEEVGPWDWGRRYTAVDAFTLMHHDLDVCTNSLQYAMLLDVVNNLLLHVEPHRKEALERLARMRFQLQLHSVEDQRRPIQNQQTLVRTLVSKLRRLEKETYLVSKLLAENSDDLEQIQEMDRLEKLVYECKNQLNVESEELDMMLSCYKESQLLANSRMALSRSDKPPTIVRANEICFKHAQWRLTEADGQIGIADLVLSNFLYTKNSKSDDSVEHLLELGYLRMTNLLPNEIYKEVLCPAEIQHGMPIEYKKVLRIFCREKQPVGGISVKEHFEINLVPLTIGLTKKFYGTMMKFCFPERENESVGGGPSTATTSEYSGQDNSSRMGEDTASEMSEGGSTKTAAATATRKSTKAKRNRQNSNFYIHTDDVEKMKERAEKNKLFVYIKIPEVPVKVSYKGNKEKNLEDLRDVSLVIPTLEYHNMTWTWLDLLMAVRNDSKRVILSQAIKQKLQIKRNTVSLDLGSSSSPQEEDKARMLFGARHAPENKSMRKGVGGVFKFGK